jgi:hypothetical protein
MENCPNDAAVYISLQKGDSLLVQENFGGIEISKEHDRKIAI